MIHAAPVTAAPILPETLNDEQLLAQLAGDNRLAFHELATRYSDRVWRISYRILHNRQDAEDVTQEVFTTVWNQRTQWREGEAKFSTWLYRVVTNRSIDFARKQRGKSVELTDDQFESDDLSADAMLANRQTQDMLLSCLKELPEKQMRALVYFYYEELSIEEICLRMRASEDSVRSQLKRAKAAMRDILARRTQATSPAHPRIPAAEALMMHS